MFRVLAGVVLLMAMVPGAVADARGAEGASVTLTRPLQFADGDVEGALDPQDVSALMSRPIWMGGNDTEGVELTSPDDGSKRVARTCEDYGALTDKGWFASTTYDTTMESFFVGTCGLLETLSGACPARRSHVSDPVVSVGDLSLLPPTVLPALTREHEEKLRHLARSGVTVADLVEPRADPAQTGTFRAEYRYEGMTQVLEETARGDFDCDGLQDVLVFAASYVEGGSYRGYDRLVLTRCAADAPFTLLADGCAGK
jgi:hypothetical protein